MGGWGKGKCTGAATPSASPPHAPVLVDWARRLAGAAGRSRPWQAGPSPRSLPPPLPSPHGTRHAPLCPKRSVLHRDALHHAVTRQAPAPAAKNVAGIMRRPHPPPPTLPSKQAHCPVSSKHACRSPGGLSQRRSVVPSSTTDEPTTRRSVFSSIMGARRRCRRVPLSRSIASRRPAGDSLSRLQAALAH